jgi:hypothetical protein
MTARAEKDKLLAREVELAEERGAARVREQVRTTLEENRRVVRVGDQQVEVVETAVLEEALGE